MGPREPPIDELLAAAQAQFAAALCDKVAAVEALAGAGDWREARRAAHRLRGSSAAYGFAGLSDAMGKIEDVLLDAHDAPGSNAAAEVVSCLAEARAQAERAAGGES